MTAEIVWTLGAVLCIEGLILAIAPGRLESVLDILRSMPVEARRLAGMLALAVGVAVLWMARALGA